jgi:hypothetical protein
MYIFHDGTNGSAAPNHGFLKQISDRFFECRCDPRHAVPGFGGHGWRCVFKIVLITVILSLLFRLVSSYATVDGAGGSLESAVPVEMRLGR